MPGKHSKNISSASNRLKLLSLLALIIVLTFTLLVGHFIFNFLKVTKFFNISYIQIVNRPLLGNVSPEYFYQLVGPNTNIFQVDLKQLREKIESDFPQLEKVIIIKHFPNRLIFNLVGRHILAQISLGKKRYFDVDVNGFILPHSHPELNPDFPLILGLNEEYSLLKPNKNSTSGRLLYTLSFIKQYRESGWLPEERLVAIDISDNYALSLFLEGNLEVKILKAEIKTKIKILEGLLKEIRLNNPEVKCIDLRFKDVIINPKNN